MSPVAVIMDGGRTVCPLLLCSALTCFYCSDHDECAVDRSMGLKSTPSINAMAEVRIMVTLSRRAASDSVGEQVLVTARGGKGDSASLDNACSMQLLLKVIG
jgi:hypothetical protein